MKDGAKGRRRGQRFPSTAIHDLISLGSGSAETFPGMRIRSQEKEEDGEWQRRGGERDEERAKMKTGAIFFLRGPVGGFPTPTTVKHSSGRVFVIIPNFCWEDEAGNTLCFFFLCLFGFFHSRQRPQENALNQQRLPACRDLPQLDCGAQPREPFLPDWGRKKLTLRRYIVSSFFFF